MFFLHKFWVATDPDLVAGHIVIYSRAKPQSTSARELWLNLSFQSHWRCLCAPCAKMSASQSRHRRARARASHISFLGRRWERYNIGMAERPKRCALFVILAFRNIPHKSSNLLVAVNLWLCVVTSWRAASNQSWILISLWTIILTLLLVVQCLHIVFKSFSYQFLNKTSFQLR